MLDGVSVPCNMPMFDVESKRCRSSSEVKLEIPLAKFREKLRSFGWEAQNCHEPILLFGDDQTEVQRAHAILLEEGFTSVGNAQTREARAVVGVMAESRRWRER